MRKQAKIYLAVLGGAALVMALLAYVNRLQTAAYEAGKTEVLLRLHEGTESMRRAIDSADVSEGDIDEDLRWITDELDRLGVQYTTPAE